MLKIEVSQVKDSAQIKRISSRLRNIEKKLVRLTGYKLDPDNWITSVHAKEFYQLMHSRDREKSNLEEQDDNTCFKLKLEGDFLPVNFEEITFERCTYNRGAFKVKTTNANKDNTFLHGVQSKVAPIISMFPITKDHYIVVCEHSVLSFCLTIIINNGKISSTNLYTPQPKQTTKE